MSIRPFSLQSVAKEVVARATSRQLVRLEIDPDLPPALGDEAKVGQVLWLLVRNALQVSPPEVPVLLALSATDSRVVAKVDDRGPSMPEDALPRLFEISHVYPAAIDKREGLGLGLFVARGIARALGGDVRYARPSDGASEGNSFVLTIARANPSPLAADSE